jgi:hypothetical protein
MPTKEDAKQPKEIVINIKVPAKTPDQTALFIRNVILSRLTRQEDRRIHFIVPPSPQRSLNPTRVTIEVGVLVVNHLETSKSTAPREHRDNESTTGKCLEPQRKT